VAVKIATAAIVFLTASALAGVALADALKPSPADFDRLIDDITAYQQRCHNVLPGQADAYKRCQDERAQLIERQKQIKGPYAYSTGSSQGAARSWQKIDALVGDIKAYLAACRPPPNAAPQQCLDQKADLIARQKKLDVRDDDIRGELANDPATYGAAWP
jgi:hypothetical protein